MNEYQRRDTDLIDRIASGDWASEVAPPPLSRVTTLIKRRRRRRRTIAVGGLGLVCATVATVVALQPDGSSPSGTGPATNPTPRGATHATALKCATDDVLVAKSRTGPGAARTQTVFLENVGAASCVIAQVPEVVVRDGAHAVTIDTSEVWGPWELARHEAVFISVSAHPHTSCTLTPGQQRKTTFNLTVDGVTYSFPIPDLRAMACGVAPVLSGVYVAKVGG